MNRRAAGTRRKHAVTADPPRLLAALDGRLIFFVPRPDAMRRLDENTSGAHLELGFKAHVALDLLSNWLDRNDGSDVALEHAIAKIVRPAAIASNVLTLIPGSLASWQKRKAMEMLSQDLERAIELDEVARACRLSRKHFSRAFQRSVGVPPYQWRLSVRLAHARKLLASTEESLTYVANACGFGKLAHFSHTFSKSTGVSPRQWRQLFGRSGEI